MLNRRNCKPWLTSEATGSRRSSVTTRAPQARAKRLAIESSRPRGAATRVARTARTERAKRRRRRMIRTSTTMRFIPIRS